MSRANINAKGRKTRGTFALLPSAVLTHPAVATLSNAAFRVLVYLAEQYKGHNNGALGITFEQMKKYGVRSHHTFYDALKALEARGLIQTTHPASRVPPRPTMYALTWQRIDDTKYSTAQRRPLNTFRDWTA